jgi:hypothetical protein
MPDLTMHMHMQMHGTDARKGVKNARIVCDSIVGVRCAAA